MPEQMRPPDIFNLERERAKNLPEKQKRIFEHFWNSIEKIKKGEANEESINYVRNIARTVNVNIEGLIDQLQRGERLTPILNQDLLQISRRLHLLLLTSIGSEDLENENIRKNVEQTLRRLKLDDIETVGEIWEGKEEGINFTNSPEAENLQVPEDTGKADIEIPEGFYYYLQPNVDFWIMRWRVEKEPEEAAFATELLKTAEKIRNLDLRLSKIKFPEEIKQVLLEEDEYRKIELLDNLKEDDRALTKVILNIQTNFLELFQKIIDLKRLEKTTSPEELKQLTESIKNKFDNEIKNYEEAIKKLEERFGTTYQPDQEIYKGFTKRVSNWLKDKGSLILGGIGLWGLAIGWFLPLWIISKMYKEIESGPLMKK